MPGLAVQNFATSPLLCPTISEHYAQSDNHPCSELLVGLLAPLSLELLVGLLAPLSLLRGRGVTAAPAAKLPFAPGMVRRCKPVDRTARRPSELGKKLGPAADSLGHH